MKRPRLRGSNDCKVKSERAVFKRQVAKEPMEPEYDPQEYVPFCVLDGEDDHECEKCKDEDV